MSLPGFSADRGELRCQELSFKTERNKEKLWKKKKRKRKVHYQVTTEPSLIGFFLGHEVNEVQKWISPQIVKTTGVGGCGDREKRRRLFLEKL